MRSLLNQPSEESRQLFLDLNPPQSDSDFISACFPIPDFKQAEVAIAIRCAIAKLKKVSSESLRANGLLPSQFCLHYRLSFPCARRSRAGQQTG